MKSCSVCKVEKPLIEYNKSPQTSDGHSFRCKACQSIYYKGYNAARKTAQVTVVVQSKVCRDCHLEKPISQFGKRSTSPDKYNIYCKPCWRERVKIATRRMRNGRKTQEAR